MARGGVFLLALLLLAPSANYQYFDGLPLDGWQEFAGGSAVLWHTCSTR